ncbi:MAG: Aspartate/glutamate/uridylate kinase [Monoraphidium minutum]|nr:MAG: Aspartate/glutamate/uridylate kinase [Monoraphidium minutum]
MLAQQKASLASLASRQAVAPRMILGNAAARVALPMAAGRAPAGAHASRRAVQMRSTATPAPPAPATKGLQAPGRSLDQVDVVYKFGGSSVRDAERMREVADIVCSFPEHLPCVVLSAMGKTTNHLLECGDLALTCGTDAIPALPPLRKIRELHLATCDELGVEPAVRAEVEKLLNELQQLLIGINIMQDLTARAKDSLVSFGERMSTRIFASFLRAQGVPARQHDAWDLGFTTDDNFGNADIIYEDSLPKVQKTLTFGPDDPRELPIVTGFLAKGKFTRAVTTLGRGGSDLSATVLGASLQLKEVQVWKDVDGVLTSDPRIVSDTRPVTELTFEEATELAYFGAQVLHPLAMQPAVRSGSLNVRVKNSYNRGASGTVITKTRDLSSTVVTSIVLKPNVTMVDVHSTRMLGAHGFLSKVFAVFAKHQVSVDVVATSEVSVSLTLDPKRIWTEGEADEEIDRLVYDLEKIATTNVAKDSAILSLICNVSRTSEILQRAFSVLRREEINVQMMSQGASKVNISLVIDAADGQRAVRALHEEFFGGAAAN